MDASDVDARIRSLYGGALPTDAGVVHVVAVWRAPDGPPRVLRIEPRTPASDTDAFALSLCRARADAIVTTGRILREEPELVHALPPALEAWREQRMGRSASPISLVLTSGQGLDSGHPLFRSSAPPLPFTSREGAAAIDPGLRPVGHPDPSLRAAIEWLRRERGARTIAVEAGPSTALTLYDAPLAVDELMLSVCELQAIPEPVKGAPFLAVDELESLFPKRSEPVSIDGWSFRRLWRR